MEALAEQSVTQRLYKLHTPANHESQSTEETAEVAAVTTVFVSGIARVQASNSACCLNEKARLERATKQDTTGDENQNSPQQTTTMASDDQNLSKYVTLISSDGFEFVVLREAACISGAIKRMLDPQSECSSAILLCACDVLTPAIQANSRNLLTDDAVLKKSSTLINPSVVLLSLSIQPTTFQSPYASVIRSNTKRLVSSGQEKAPLSIVAEHRSMIIAKLGSQNLRAQL